MRDSGAAADSGATTVTDSGTTVTDSGTTVTDSGTTVTDSGTTVTDSGTTATDAGHAVPTDAGAADWATRIQGPGVVWYHSFDTAAEVDAFRWVGGYGNDPTGERDRAAAPDGALHCHWVSAGGAEGAGYLQVDRPEGTSDVGMWWRPFSPLTGATNGRGVDDPAANGTLALGSFNSNVNNALYNWADDANPTQGWYGPTAGQYFDGTEFYLQVRVMADPRRTSPGNIQGGKFVWLTTSTFSYVSQELVSYQMSTERNVDGVGVPNYFNLYQGYNYENLYQVATTNNGTHIQLGSALSGGCDPYEHLITGCWAYATNGTWDTLLYHVVPGADGTPTTHLEVFAAHAGESTYTKITDLLAPIHFDAATRTGWNALILGTYANGFQGIPNTAFWAKYDQVIFSKQFIACPKS